MGYGYYLRKHKRHALRLVSQQQLDADYALLEQLHALMQEVGMRPGLKELEENLGYIYFSDEYVYHGFTPQKLESLYAIRDGDLETLRRLHKEGHGMYGYKRINVRLAIKYGHANIVEYLVDNRWINCDLNEAIGQLASPQTFRALENLTRRPLKDGRTLPGYFHNLSVLDRQDILRHTFKCSYEDKGEFSFYGLDNWRLRGFLSPRHI